MVMMGDSERSGRHLNDTGNRPGHLQDEESVNAYIHTHGDAPGIKAHRVAFYRSASGGGVGESGSWRSTLARSLLKIRVVSGLVVYWLSPNDTRSSSSQRILSSFSEHIRCLRK